MSTSEKPAGRIETAGAARTLELGEILGRGLAPGSVVALAGELGSGKTVLTKGIARGLGVPDEGEVVSPTFVFLKIHRGRVPLYHLDAYRLTRAEQFRDLGVESYVGGDGVCVIEWADRVAAALPADRMEIRLTHRGPERRRIEFFPLTPEHKQLIAAVLRSMKESPGATRG